LAIDSTECDVNGRLSKIRKWKKSTHLASVKLHAVWNVENEWIDQFQITGGKVGDATVAKTLKIKENCMYVFDRAYNELNFWWRIISHESHFVTRIKNVRRVRLKKLSLPKTKVGVLWEGEWKPSKATLEQKKYTDLPKDFTLRHIIYRDPETKKVFDFITSENEISAQEVADIYKKRWAVELLFRWL